MRTTNNNRKSKFLAFLLSVMVVTSAGAVFASCKDSGDISSSSSSSVTEEKEETKKDTGAIKNANFDFTTTTKTTVIGTSVTGWSRSVYSTSSGSASSSKSASGVIDVSADKWSYMTESAFTKEQLEAMSDAEAIEKWDTFKVKDKLAYYDIWKAREDNKEKTISTDFSAYESINIDEEDIPTVANPGKAPESEDDSVLMIHNHYYTSSSKKDQLVGTAQKYTSSSTVTVAAGTSKKVSVWVKTADLKSVSSDGTTQDAVGKGAYISVNHSVGGKSLDAFEVKNINTNGEWKQYTFYIKGSYYADTTFSLVLGLGQGSTTDRLEYVNGYAFFDKIVLEDLDNGAFETETAGMAKADLDDEKVDKTIDAYTKDATKFAMDFYGTKTWDTVDMADDLTGTVTSAKPETVNPEAASTDVAKVFANQTAISTEAASNEYLGYVYNNFFDFDKEKDTDTDFVGDNEVLMFLSTNGTAYSMKDAMSFTLPAENDHMAISFFVKTSDLNGGTGAGVTLTNGLNKTSFTAIDTSDLEGVKMGDDEDAYDGWQQVFFFMERDEETTGDLTFTLSFNYGPTEIDTNTASNSFAQGFAAFTKFTTYTGMSELEYETAATGTYAKKVVLKADEEDKAAGNSGFDSATGVPSNALENGLAIPQNYKGVYNDSARVKDTTAEDLESGDDKLAYNNYNGDAGLINREKFLEYFGTNTDAWLTSLKATAPAGADAAAVWEYHFGDALGTATQPLVIMNDTTATKSYGFIGTEKSTSEEYTAVSLRVKTFNASASVYLIDMSDDSYQSVLSVSRALTYWYDDDGNVCTGDPSKNSSTIAFKLQKNGLYKANKNWESYEKLGDMKDMYFANLSAYTESNGILYAAADSAIHDYYDYTWNREMFYKHGENYYTEANGAGDKVIDFASITKDVVENGILPARYTAEAKQELKIENINTNGKWATVTFYIRQGSAAKNYRLEVWSGTRTGNPNKVANGYVAFDSNPGVDASTFETLYEEEYKDLEGVTKFDGVFSYFDTNKHVRYNADLDTDKSGNVYEESFVPSSYTESLAFLAYLNNRGDNIYDIYANYAVSEQTVAAQEKTDDTVEDSSEEEKAESELNVWLLASSIAVAGVLVLAVVSIIARKVIESYKKKHGARARKTVKEKKVSTAKKVEKKVDEDSPYND